MSQGQADIGMIGLAVMGRNLALNFSDHGLSVAAYSVSPTEVDVFLNGDAKGRAIFGARSIAEFVGLLKAPRRIMMMIRAGAPVDEVIESLLPVLSPGDIIIDGGNSNFDDTNRRTQYVQSKGLLYIGTGVSGGEEGARHGPSMMPGGSPAAWPAVKPLFQAIAAKATDPKTGRDEPCCDWVGENGAGHFVKMVHNGIEYALIQLICEAYDMMRAAGMTAGEMHEVFAAWNKGKLQSYLIEITAEILAKIDPETGGPLVDVILDAAGQKGTGKWTVITGADLAMPVTTIAEAVFARCVSALKDERVVAGGVLKGPKPIFRGDRKAYVKDLESALYCGIICAYAQGFQLMRAAAKEYGWNLNYGGVAMMWRGGCIIRSISLAEIKNAFDKNQALANLLLDRYFGAAIRRAQGGLRRTIARAIRMGIPSPVLSAAVAYYDGYRSQRLPANLLQAQRDYFGAHTYERVDAPRGQFFHTNWTGAGGDVTAGTYNA